MNQPPRRRRRNGYTMIVVLALAALTTALAVGWAREALRVHRASRLQHLKTQADWLVHAGLGRAVARLRADPNYTGETWGLTAAQTTQPVPAEVLLEVVRGGGEGDEEGRGVATLRCRVRLPPGDNRRVQLTREIPLPKITAPSPTAPSPTDPPPAGDGQGETE